MRPTRVLTLFALLALGCDARAKVQPPAAKVTAARKPAGFLKGQLHAHTGSSGDSDTDPAEAAAWYAARGYDFVVFTDHNVVTELPAPPGMLLLRGVELTQNLPTCEPPPARREHCLLHVSALFVGPSRDAVRFPRPDSLKRADLYARAVDRAIAMGGLAQLDHPNFHHGADLGVVMALATRGVGLMEIENAAVDSNNEGDVRTPSTEALWDAALNEGARIFGTATDDAHHYEDAARVRARGEIAYTGDRGFVMVQAEKTAESIRAAIAGGAFYATTGVILDRVVMGREGVEVDVAAESGPCTIEVIAGGRVVETVRGASLRFDPRRTGARWVRVRVTDTSGRKALTQPVWL